MRKISNYKEKLLHKKREKKEFKRRRIGSVRYGNTIQKLNKFKKNNDILILSKSSFSLDTFFSKNEFNNWKYFEQKINIPHEFQLEFNYADTMDTISLIRKTILENKGKKIFIDFSNCKKVDFAALFLMKIVIEETVHYLTTLNHRLSYFNINPRIKIIHSKKEKVNLKLLANEIIPDAYSSENDFIPISYLNLIRGRKNQRHYTENKKGVAVTKIKKYINGILREHGVEFNEEGGNNFEGLLTEILGNAEDHNSFDYWYVFGNFFRTNKTKNIKEVIGEINLAIINFGSSIYEGFEETKNENIDVYSAMESLYEKSKNNSNYFTKENYFTLFALQEGISRLKHKEPSRGTGTIKFIESFLYLGDYEDKTKNFHPRMLIYSGNTLVKCDNEHKPFEQNGNRKISLNKEKNLNVSPDKSHLKKLNRKFPGTLIVSKIYLSESHLKNKISNNERK